MAYIFIVQIILLSHSLWYFLTHKIQMDKVCLYFSYSDKNKITNATGYGQEAFGLSSKSTYRQKLGAFHKAFTKYTALHTL